MRCTSASGGAEKTLPPSAASLSLRGRICGTVRGLGQGARLKGRAWCKQVSRDLEGRRELHTARSCCGMHLLSLECWWGARERSASWAAPQKRGKARAWAQNFVRGDRGQGRGAGRFSALGGMRERERKRRHKGRGSTTEPRSSSKWHRPALCLPTSCQCAPALRSIARGLGVRRPKHKGGCTCKQRGACRGKRRWEEEVAA